MANTTTYNANPKLKKTFVPISFTTDQVKEIKKCIKDPYYFFKNYYWVKNADGDELLFNPYPYQKEFLDTILGNRYTICKMSRQCRQIYNCRCLYVMDYPI